jgi:hypothetical protein
MSPAAVVVVGRPGTVDVQVHLSSMGRLRALLTGRLWLRMTLRPEISGGDEVAGGASGPDEGTCAAESSSVKLWLVTVFTESLAQVSQRLVRAHDKREALELAEAAGEATADWSTAAAMLLEGDGPPGVLLKLPYKR